MENKKNPKEQEQLQQDQLKQTDKTKSKQQDERGKVQEPGDKQSQQLNKQQQNRPFKGEEGEAEFEEEDETTSEFESGVDEQEDVDDRGLGQQKQKPSSGRKEDDPSNRKMK